MLLIIGSLFEAPEEGTHGLFAIRLILLGCESLLVSGHLREVDRTCGYGCCYCRETRTDLGLLGGHRGRTSDRVQTADVQTRAVRALGRGYTVSSENHLLVGCVLGLFVDFGESTADGLDCVSIFYFCHARSAIGVHWFIPLR